MRPTKENAYFCVRMMGNFSIQCQGKELTIGRKSTLKFIQLLQMVWLLGDRGATKEQLINRLYGESEIANSNNSFNNLLYQLRKQLVKAGLPEGEYIVRRDGVYVPDEKFPVWLDVDEFRYHIGKAREAMLPRMREESYLEAVKLYRGELLQSINTENWVMAESIRLKECFQEAVRWLGSYYREQEHYKEALQIYENASAIYPYDSWQIGEVDVLMERGEYRQAYRRYLAMVNRYTEEVGCPLPKEMHDCWERINQKIQDIPQEIKNIMGDIESLRDEESEKQGAYYCGYQSFVDICHILSRSRERTGRQTCLMMCTLVDYEGRLLQDKSKLKSRGKILEQVLSENLRKGDIYTRYSNSQYLLLLSGITQDKCDLVFQRINTKFRELAGARARIAYRISEVENL